MQACLLWMLGPCTPISQQTMPQKLWRNSLSNMLSPIGTIVLEGLKFVLHNNLMHFRDKISHQIFGTAMGTPLAPVLTNLYLHILENKLKSQIENDMHTVAWPLFLKENKTLGNYLVANKKQPHHSSVLLYLKFVKHSVCCSQISDL